MTDTTGGGSPMPRYGDRTTWAPAADIVRLTACGADVLPYTERVIAWIAADELVSLAEGPDAARDLNSRRGYLPDSQQNRRFAWMLRDRPEDFGASGTPILMGADYLGFHPHRPDRRVTLELHGMECIDGFQRLVILNHAFRELRQGHLSRTRLRVEIVTGAAREQARRQHHDDHLYLNSAHPRDNLSRCIHLTRIRDQFAGAGTHFDYRRGVVAGPHSCGYDVADVFRALACCTPGRSPVLAHALSTDSGLGTVWSDLADPYYVNLMNADVHAWSVERATAAYTAARQVLARLDTTTLTGHDHLIRYAPDLIIWAACGTLPLHGLHLSGRTAPRWDTLIDCDAFRNTVEAAATSLVSAYKAARPRRPSERRPYKGEGDQLDVWWEIVDRVRWLRER
ncbi:hypothetical protein ACOKM3_02185 [Streptomyces sp. BH106]|uniref:hypothetical protein n=1 Tax=Streptomyces sp. BH106 TaxID=3410409 RepID=UPI003CF747C9